MPGCTRPHSHPLGHWNYISYSGPRVHDICSSVTMTSHRGFIRSPRYPDNNYTADLHCACRLQTEDHGIMLQILDFSLSQAKISTCQGDFLKISGKGKKCGSISPRRLPEKLKLDTHDLSLQFRTDSRRNARGFWLEYTGMDDMWLILQIEGILPKGPYLPCVSMAGRALLAGYHRNMCNNSSYWKYTHVPDNLSYIVSILYHHLLIVICLLVHITKCIYSAKYKSNAVIFEKFIIVSHDVGKLI